MYIFIVCGQSGSYSNENTTSWIVKAFTDADQASAYAEKLDRRVTRLYKCRDAYEARFKYDAYLYRETKYFDSYGTPKPDALDPGRVWAWDVPRYEVVSIELV